MARKCENCDIKMPAFRPRMRDDDGRLLCAGCHPDGMGGEGRPVGHHGQKLAWGSGSGGSILAGDDPEPLSDDDLEEALRNGMFEGDEALEPWVDEAISRGLNLHGRDRQLAESAGMDHHTWWEQGWPKRNRDIGRLSWEAKLAPGACPRCYGRGRVGMGGGAIRCLRCKGSGKAPKTGSLQFEAHDSGDGETIYHCPFCGGGSVVGRSDGTVECDFCQTAFTVQVQPMKSGQPQTFNGQPLDMPGMPGAQGDGMQSKEPGAAPEAADVDDEFAVIDEAQPSPVGGGGGGAPPADPNLEIEVISSRYYLTEEGVLDGGSFMKHLALRYADDRSEVLDDIRAENRGDPSRRP